MKKLILKTIAYFLSVLIIAALPNVIIDPYNVFHTDEPRDNGIESNKSFIKTEYLKKHHDEMVATDGIDSLVFGSSRAGFVDIAYLNEATGGKFYNMASSESVVSEQTTELKAIINSGFTPKRVWVFVDDISCFVGQDLHKNRLYKVSYPEGISDRAEFYLKYMDTITSLDSLKVIKDNRAKKIAEAADGVDSSYDQSTEMGYLDRFYHTGTERLDKESSFDPNEEQYQKGYWVDYYSLRVDEAIADIKELADVCDKNGIELTVMTNPLYHLTYRMDIENGYLDYLKALAEVTDYYNFSSFNDVTEDYRYYYETSHFMPSVTRMMMDCVTGSGNGNENSNGNSNCNSNDIDGGYDSLKNQGFGVKVTKENVDEIISLLEEQALNRGIQIKR